MAMVTEPSHYVQSTSRLQQARGTQLLNIAN